MTQGTHNDLLHYCHDCFLQRKKNDITVISLIVKAHSDSTSKYSAGVNTFY